MPARASSRFANLILYGVVGIAALFDARTALATLRGTFAGEYRCRFLGRRLH